jgi:hypothetical protein
MAIFATLFDARRSTTPSGRLEFRTEVPGARLTAFAVLLASGSACFGQSAAFVSPATSTVTGVTEIAVADFDANGLDDLVVVGSGATQAAVHRNLTGLPGATPGTLAGGVLQSTGFSTSYPPESVAAADVNGDGLPDFAVGTIGPFSSCTNTNFLKLFLNGGTAPALSFTAQTTQSVAYSVSALAFGNVQGLAGPELLVADKCNNQVRIYTYTGNAAAPFSQVGVVAVGVAPTSITARDVDGDGDLDFVTGNAGDVSVAYNFGAGSFVVVTVAAVATGGVDLADVDGNGLLDVVAIGGCAGAFALLRQLAP